MKKVLVTLGFIMIFSVALPVFALTAASSPSVAVTCVSNAVNARENAIDTSITTHSQAITSAYAIRATALQQAYAASTTVQIKSSIKTTWLTFNNSVRIANTAWRTARNSAWSTFRTLVKACKAPVSINDSADSAFEVAGQ